MALKTRNRCKIAPSRIESRAPGQARTSPERISGQNGPIPMILLIGARGKILL
jgi:hypothetical protein